MDNDQNASQVNSQSELFTKAKNVLAGAKGWIMFFGILSLLGGILQCLSIVGIIIGWLPIWIGVILMQAAGAITNMQNTGDESELIIFLSKIKSYFSIQGIFILVSLALGFIVSILYGAVIFSMIANGEFF